MKRSKDSKFGHTGPRSKSNGSAEEYKSPLTWPERDRLGRTPWRAAKADLDVHDR